jgi:hypothetical protein
VFGSRISATGATTGDPAIKERRMKAIVMSFGCLFAASCGVQPSGSQQILVSQPNHLGVTEIQTTHVAQDGDQIFELRGLDASGEQLALFRLRTGVIADLPDFLPGSTRGSEIVISVAGSDTRMVTRETALFQLGVVSPSETQQFLEISTVASTLAHEANVLVAKAPAAGEVAFLTETCSPSLLLASPLAEQCCYGPYGHPGGPEGEQTLFAKDSNGVYTVVSRIRNPYGTACKASDGVGDCDGGGCYFGPLGFARAVVQSAPAGYPDPIIESARDNNILFCADQWSTQVGVAFGNVTGSNPTGAGCPGKGGSGDNEGYQDWDY